MIKQILSRENVKPRLFCVSFLVGLSTLVTPIKANAGQLVTCSLEEKNWFSALDHQPLELMVQSDIQVAFELFDDMLIRRYGQICSPSITAVTNDKLTYHSGWDVTLEREYIEMTCDTEGYREEFFIDRMTGTYTWTLFAKSGFYFRDGHQGMRGMGKGICKVTEAAF